MSSINGRALHYVFKVADRKQTCFFYRSILGMKILRHEEFADGCEAACNGFVFFHVSLVFIYSIEFPDLMLIAGAKLW